MFLNINCVDLDYGLIMPNNMFVCLFSFTNQGVQQNYYWWDTKTGLSEILIIIINK